MDRRHSVVLATCKVAWTMGARESVFFMQYASASWLQWQGRVSRGITSTSSFLTWQYDKQWAWITAALLDGSSFEWRGLDQGVM